MSLIDRMVALNAKLTSIPIRLGDPGYRNLLVRHSTLDDDLLGSSIDTLFEPKPLIKNVPTRLVGLEVGGNSIGGGFQSGAISIAQDDFQVSNIPRSYALSFLTQDVDFFVIDPAVVAAGDGSLEVLYDARGLPAGGFFCRVLSVSDRDALTWSLILRRHADHYDSDRERVDY